MTRVVPWRNKPTPLISQMIPIAKQLKLYLVNEIGPTNLVLKDQNDNKFKVVIGDVVNCSCRVVKNDHCIHSLFVLLKKFQVSEDHPILWQASYLDSQLDGMTQQKYKFSKKPTVRTTAKEFLKRKKQEKKQQDDDFPPLDQQQVCPICYEQMKGQCYSSCDTCHKSFHTKCFKVWTKHKQDSQNPVTCPMCRTKFNSPMAIILKDLQRWQAKFSTHKGSFCKGCGQKNIKGTIFKCLMCPNTDLCKLCYDGNQHLDHDIFCVRELITDQWKLAPVRARKTRKQLFQASQELDLKQLPNLQSPEFILCLLPTIKQFNAKQATTELGIVGNFLLTKNMCTKCHTLGNEEMIRLNCSHPIHEQCLLSMVKNQEYCCQIDNEVICPGYWAAMGIKVVQKSKKTTDIKFMRNKEESQLLQRKNAMNQMHEHQQSNKKQSRNMSLGLVGKETITGVNRISGIKMKQTTTKSIRPPTIPKKSLQQRRHQIQSLSIGGLGMKFGGNMITPGFSLQGYENSNQNFLGQIIGSQNNIMQNRIGPKRVTGNHSNKNSTFLQR